MLSKLLLQRLGHTTPLSIEAMLEEHLVSTLRPGETVSDRLSSLTREPLDSPAWRQLLERALVPKTQFFRHWTQLSALRETYRSQPVLRIWSAGCATGEEPHSLSILFGSQAREILATDVSEDYLSFARSGTYPRCELDSLRQEFRSRVTPAPDGGIQVPDPERARIRFRSLNLLQGSFPWASDGRPWDLIFCRNVLIYFSQHHRAEVLRQFAQRLAPNGTLVLSPAERAPDETGLQLVPLNSKHTAFGFKRRAEAAEADRDQVSRLDWGATTVTESPISGTPLSPAPPSAPVPVDSSRQAQELIELSGTFEGKRDFEAALDALARAEVAADLSSELHHAIGRAYRRLSRPRQAAEALRRALLLDPECWPAAFSLAGSLFELGQLQESVREYERTIRILEPRDDLDPFYQSQVLRSCADRVAECKWRSS